MSGPSALAAASVSAHDWLMDTKLTRSDCVVVVGVDGSAGAERALRWAAVEAVRISATLRIVNAWTVLTRPLSLDGGFAYLDMGIIEQGARGVVEGAAQTVRRAGAPDTLRIETSIVQGGAAERLLEAADQACLLVVGSRGHGGFASLVLGSVAATCAHHSSVPLAVIGSESPAPGTGEVVVGFDDSHGGRAALRWAAGEALRMGVSVRAVHAWNLPPSPPDRATEVETNLRPDVVEAARHGLQRLVDGELDELAVRPIIDVVSVGLPAAEALLREARSAALLVVGARGRGGFAGLLLGSVSQQCLYHSPCPLVIVPAGARS